MGGCLVSRSIRNRRDYLAIPRWQRVISTDLLSNIYARTGASAGRGSVRAPEIEMFHCTIGITSHKCITECLTCVYTREVAQCDGHPPSGLQATAGVVCQHLGGCVPAIWHWAAEQSVGEVYPTAKYG